jgi:L-alanine-DL-glutamate epimerase-like enolase superfamily enzyme
MKITDVIEKTFPISSPIRNAYIDFRDMTLSAVAVVTDVIIGGRQVIGYGFNSNGRYAQGALLRERVIPRLLQADPDSLLSADRSNLDPFRIWDVMMSNEKPGGHGERAVAVGTVDMAVWDAVAKIEDRPLFELLADRYGTQPAEPRVFVYAAGGYYRPDGDIAALVDEMRGYLDRGYAVVKMKIGGAPLRDDMRRIEAVLRLLGPQQRLAVDANGRFDRRQALDYAAALSEYELFWFEEPGDPLDFDLLADVAQAYPGALGTGENLLSVSDARNLIRYGGLRPDRDWLQFDPALSYGLVEYLRTLAMLADQRWSADRCIPHGGHQMALNIAAGLGLGGNESYPDLFQPFGGFPDECTVDNGYVTLPEHPGIGFEAKSDLYRVLASLTP